LCALGVALLGEVLKRAEAIGHIAKHTEASGREVLEVRIFGEVDPIDHPARLCVPVADARADGPVVIDVDLQFAFELVAPACAAILDVGRRSEVRPQEMTVLVQQISRRQENSVAVEGDAVEEAGRDLRAETQGRPHRLVVDDLGSEWNGHGPRRSPIAATDIVRVAAGAIGAHRFLPVIGADKRSDHEVASIANLDVLTDIQGDIDRALAPPIAYADFPLGFGGRGMA
jgi:hypothetical protein